MAEQRREVAQHPRLAVRIVNHPVDEVGPRKMQALPRNARASVSEQMLGVGPEQGCDVGHGHYSPRIMAAHNGPAVISV